MSLTSCIRKAGAALNAEDKAAILEAARQNRKAGMSADDAARAAVDARLVQVRAMLADAEAGKVEPAATHQDPGEAPEAATKPVIAEALKTAARSQDVPIKDVKAEALRLIDEAIAKAPSSAEVDAQINVNPPKTIQGKQVMTGVRSFGDSSVLVEARETRDGKWSVTDESYDGSGTGRKRRTVLGELQGTPALAREQLMGMLRRLREDGTLGEPDLVTIDVPGDGEFTVVNTKERLTEFRKKVDASPGFKTQRPGPIESQRVNGARGGYGDRAGQAFGVESGSGPARAAIEGMIDEGDAQAAVDYAAMKGLDLAEVLKGQPERLKKVQGVTPTEAAAEPEAPAPAAAAAVFPTTPQGAIDAWNADDAAQAMQIVAKIRTKDALREVGDGIGYPMNFGEAAEAFRKRLADVAPRLTKTAREKARRQRTLYDKLMDRAMDYDRAADHMERSLRLGNAVDSQANTTVYKPMGDDRVSAGDWLAIPQALDLLAADVASLKSDPDYAEVAPMVRDKRPRVFEHTPTAAAAPAQEAQEAPAEQFPRLEFKPGISGLEQIARVYISNGMDSGAFAIGLKGFYNKAHEYMNGPSLDVRKLVDELGAAGFPNPGALPKFYESLGGKRAPEANADMPPTEPATPPMPAVAGIPRDLAQRAHSGTSFVPEDRARQEQQSFNSALADAWARAMRAAGNDEAAQARVREVFDDVQEGYRARYMRTLEARSRVMSSMIAGPARFPVDRNRKRMETERKRAEEASEYLARGIKRMLRAARGPIDNSPESELERIRLNLQQREESQEVMKAANAALRKGDDDALRDLGLTDEQIAELKKPDFAGRTGFADYRLKNNNAEIRRLRERLAEAEKRVAAAAAGPQETERNGVRIVEDAQDDRLRLFFDGKPSDEVREDLKRNGFKWSPSAGAWQRQLTNAARYEAQRLVDKHFPATPEAGESFSLTENTDELLQEFGRPASNKLEAERAFSDGDRLFIVHDMSEDVTEVTSIKQIEPYTADQILILPANAKFDVKGWGTVDASAKPVDIADYAAASPADKDAVRRLQDAIVARGLAGLRLDAVPARTGAPAGQPVRGTDRDRFAVVQLAKRLFDKQATYFAASVPFANGVVSSAQPGRIFLRFDMQSPHLAVFGHELLHSMRQDRPDLYDALRQRIAAITVDRDTRDERLQAKYDRLGLPRLSAEKLDEEFIADVVGDNFTDPEFWRTLAKGQPAGFRKVMEAVQRWLDDVIERLTNLRPFNTDLYLRDLGAAREAVADAMRNYSAGEVGTVAEGEVSFSLTRGEDAFRRRLINQSLLAEDPPGFFKAKLEEAGQKLQAATGYEAVEAYGEATFYDQDGAGMSFDELPAKARKAAAEYMKILDVWNSAEQGYEPNPVAGDLDFSLAADAAAPGMAQKRPIQQKVRNTLSDMLGSAGARVTWWEKTLGTQYAKAEKHPEFKRVFDLTQQYLEDTSSLANEAADKAAGILPKMETWKDLKTAGGLADADAKAIAGPIFEGTLTDKKVYSDAELVSRFGLKPPQIKLYRDFMAAVNVSLDQAVASDVLRLLGDKNPALRELAITDRDGLRDGVRAYLQEQIEAGIDEDGNAELLKQINEKYDRIAQLKAEGYAPLMRFGEYSVHVMDAETGETKFFGLYEDRKSANRMARELGSDPDFKGAKIEQGVLSQDQYRMFSGMPLDSLELFAAAIGADKADVFQEYIRLAKNNRSAMKRLLKRKGTAGFSEDVSRVLAAFVTSNARMAAGAMSLPAAKEAAIEIRAGDVKDEAIRLLDTVQNPRETAGAIRGLMFANFIGGSIASAMVNLTQPITMTLPYLSQWGGGVKAAARLMAAGKAAASGRVADAELRKALARAEAEGVVSPQEIHHLTAQAAGTWGTNPWLRRAAFVWAAPFSLAEQFNRRVSFIAAYNTAREQGIEDPFAFAEKAVIETQGLYNKANAPNWARNPIGAVALTFKQFSIHYLEWMGRMWRSGPEGKKAVALALALLIVAAGTDGLPGADDLDDLIDTLGQALGYDMNAKKARRQFVAETLGMGDMGADIVARGFSAVPGIPMDVSLRMGMGNLFPATGLFLRSETDKSRELLELAGPAGSLGKQAMDAGAAALRGDPVDAVRSALPIALQNVGKALTMWETGEARDQLGRKVMEADEVDGLMRFLGFNPQAIARESEKLGMIRRSEQLAKNVEGEIVGDWARAVVDGDQQGIADAKQRLADWNARNPDQPIRVKPEQIRARAKKLRETREQRFITSTAPERRQALREALAAE